MNDEDSLLKTILRYRGTKSSVTCFQKSRNNPRIHQLTDQQEEILTKESHDLAPMELLMANSQPKDPEPFD